MGRVRSYIRRIKSGKLVRVGTFTRKSSIKSARRLTSAAHRSAAGLNNTRGGGKKRAAKIRGFDRLHAAAAAARGHLELKKRIGDVKLNRHKGTSHINSSKNLRSAKAAYKRARGSVVKALKDPKLSFGGSQFLHSALNAKKAYGASRLMTKRRRGSYRS